MPAPTLLHAAILLAVGLLAPAAPAPAQFGASFEGPARQAAEPWLKMLDDGRYDEAWETTWPPFKEGKRKTDWMRQQKDRAEEHGPLSRMFASSMHGKPLHRFPGVDVDVIVELLSYTTVDANRKRWAESVWMVREVDKDGPWLVLDYALKPLD